MRHDVPVTSLRKSHVFAIIGCVLLVVVVSTIAWLVARDAPAERRTFENTGEPGDLVSMEDWQGVHGTEFDIWKIEYVTTDRHGEPRTVTALVSAAANRPDKKLPVVAFAHGTVGVAESCAPSDRAKPVTTDAGAIAAIAAQGAVIVAPDYSGLGSEGPHGFMVGEEAAHDILDAVRAVRQIPDVNVNRKAVVWGQSQGGHAALWAAIEQPSYAPDVDLLGVAATAPPTDLVGMLEASADDPIASRLQAYLLDSWRKVYPDSGLWDEVSEANRKVIPKVAARCGNEDSAASQLQSPVLPSHEPGTAFRKLVDENEPNGKIKAPVLLAQGSADDIVPVESQRTWVAEQCTTGATIDYIEYPGSDHYTVIFAMLSDLLTWTVDRLADKPAPTTC